MIGTDEMSSTGMDISESFRAEDLAKTDFFDFVTASEMGIGVGIGSVGVGVDVTLQAQHHQYQQQQSQSHERLTSNSTNMTHDGGGGNSSGRNNNDNSIPNGSSSDPTLQNYEFWHTDKDPNRLDSSLFEDLDRYCWQQPPPPPPPPLPRTANAATPQLTPANTISATTTSTSHSRNIGPTGNTINCDSPATAATASTNSTNNNSNSTQMPSSESNSISQGNSTTNAINPSASLQNSDGQIYTITVLNGGNGDNSAAVAAATSTTTNQSSGVGTSPAWLKREPEETHIPTTLDLDSLLGNFSGYIKSEYPYDDSGFSTDGTKDVINGEVNGINSIQQQQQQQNPQDSSSLHGIANLGSCLQSLPSLVTTMSGGRASLNLGQQLAAQFQNNNNDWHMIDHNTDQNSAESLLRSALQGKGYAKGIHQIHNGGITLLPSSPTVKDDEMRRILFSSEADSLAFADSTLNTTQIFEESQHHTHMIQLQNSSVGSANGSSLTQSSHNNTNTSLLVDDMFLSLENAFSDDFDKMKRIANEVQQYCHTPPVESDYITSDIMMQISPTATATATQLQPLHSPTTPTAMSGLLAPQQQQATSPLTSAATTAHHLQQQIQQFKTETKANNSSTTATATTTTNSRMNPTKGTKKYKRSTSSSLVQNSNNNNNSNNNSLNIMNHNNNNNNNNNINSKNNNNASTKNSNDNNTTSNNNNNNNNNATASSSNNSTSSSVGSSSSSSNSPPTTNCNGQRKERSLHYCSICSKGFKDKYSVNVHIRTHTGEKPFACSLCGKSFRQKAHLAKHYQTHMAQKNNHGGGSGAGSAGGGISKGSSSKHHRGGQGGSSALSNASAAAQQQQRQLSLLTSSSTMSTQVGLNPSGGGIPGLSVGLNPNLLGVTSTVVTLNNPPPTGSLTTNVLTTPNGLLSNR